MSSATLLEELADEYASLEAEIAPMLARQDEIKKHFRTLDAGTHDLCGVAVTVARNARVDTKKLSSAYTAKEFPELYETKISTTLARQHLDPEMVEDFTTEGEPRLTVKVTES